MELRDKIIEVAKTYIGTPYKTLDCSAFARAVYRKFNYELPRVSATQGKKLYNLGLAKKVEKEESVSEIAAKLHTGDLVYWGNPKYGERWMEIHHVAIYASGGKTVESTGSGNGVHIGSLWETSAWQIVLTADITTLLEWDAEQKPELGRVLKYGYNGKDVYAVELALEALGYNCKITKTEKKTGIGKFRGGMKSAVGKFQKANPGTGKLVKGKWTADYKVGEKTATALGLKWAG